MKYIKTYEDNTYSLLREFCDFLVSFAKEKRLEFWFQSIFINHYEFYYRLDGSLETIFKIDKWSDKLFNVGYNVFYNDYLSKMNSDAQIFFEFLRETFEKFSNASTDPKTLKLIEYKDIEELKQYVIDNYETYADAKKYNL